MRDLLFYLYMLFCSGFASNTGHQHSNSYKLAYQDGEGDWLFAEDVSWRKVQTSYFNYITSIQHAPFYEAFILSIF